MNASTTTTTNANTSANTNALTPGTFSHKSCTRRTFLVAAAAVGLAAQAGRALPAGAQDAASTSAAPAPSWPYSSIKELLPAQEPSLRDDFYTALNYDWLSETELPDGKLRWTTFSECSASVHERMFEILRNPQEGNDDEVKAALLFSQAMDQEARDAAGLGTYYAEDLKAVLAVSTLDDLTELLVTNERVARKAKLVDLIVLPDLNDSSTNACFIKSSDIILDDTASYADPAESDANRLAAYEDYTVALLTHFGMSDAEARQMAADRTACEAALAAGMYDLTTTYRGDYETVVANNPRTREELVEAAGAFPLVGLLDARGYTANGTFVLKDPGWLATLAELYTEENVGLLRAYLAVGLLREIARDCDSTCVAAYEACTNKSYGTTGATPLDEAAYDRVELLAGDLLGRIYAAHHFPESARSDVEAMVAELLEALELRLNAADWLGEATRATAIQKLRAMGVRIGHPDTYLAWEEVEPIGASFIDNEAIVSQATAFFEAMRFGQPVDRGLWVEKMCAHTVNAFLDPSANTITFPAGILQGAFYDPAASRAANLGAIGAIIGHEITHTLDTAGSQYDKDGNLTNWWTDDDRAAFEERTAKVADYFSAIEAFDGVYVHGDLTIGENTADLGGMAAALDVLEKDADPDYDAFFRADAQVWRCMLTKEKALQILNTDAHAPGYLRANVSVQQFQQFYDTYGVVEGDGMYLAPEQRLSVW